MGKPTLTGWLILILSGTGGVLPAIGGPSRIILSVDHSTEYPAPGFTTVKVTDPASGGIVTV